MSYAYTIDESARLLVVKFWGQIPYPEEAEAVLTVLDDPRIAPGFRILVDRTESELASTPEDVRSHVDLVEKKLASLGQPRVANVVSADFDFGMIRMFESMADDRIDHEFAVFRSLAEACGWLDVDPNRVEWPGTPDA